MGLPSAMIGGIPAPTILSATRHEALSKDSSVKRGVRVAVLTHLALASNPDLLFEQFCDGEQLKGRRKFLKGCPSVGRAIRVSNFAFLISRGFVGSEPKPDDKANRAMLERVALISRRDPDRAMRVFKRSLHTPKRLPPPPDVVTWYFYTPGVEASSFISADLALRLALPTADSAGFEDYIVLCFKPASIGRKHRGVASVPRFVDAGVLRYLDYWYPGGKTKPWVPHLSGLPEVVAPPTIVVDTVIELAFVKCKLCEKA